MKNHLRIYVAGPYVCDGRCEPLGVDLTFMREGLEISAKLLSMGYAPFCPWLDYLFQLVPGGENLKREDYWEYSIAWLLVSDAMFVINDRENSLGTKEEIKIAKEHQIPVFFELKPMLEFIKKSPFHHTNSARGGSKGEEG